MDLGRGREMAQRQTVEFVVWTAGAATLGLLPLFALPSRLGQTFLVCLGAEACVSAWRTLRATRGPGKWRAASTVVLVRLWAAGLFAGAGWFRAAHPAAVAAMDHTLSGPVEQAIIAVGVAVVAWAAGRCASRAFVILDRDRVIRWVHEGSVEKEEIQRALDVLRVEGEDEGRGRKETKGGG